MNDRFNPFQLRTKDLGPVMKTNLGHFYPNLGFDSVQEGTIIPGIFQFSKQPGQLWNSITKFILIEASEYKHFRAQREAYITLQILRQKKETPYQAPLDMGQYEVEKTGDERQFFFMVFKKYLCDLKDLYQKQQFKYIWKQQKILRDIVKQMVHSVIYFNKHFGPKETNFVHRDIKPQNFIVHQTDQGWVVKLIDFGITKEIINDSCQKQYSNTLTYCGTTRYFPPEILLDFKARKTGKLSQAIDLQLVDSWSLGVSVYQFMTSHPFFRDLQTLQKTKDDFEFKQVYLNAYQDYLSQVKRRFQDKDSSANNYSKEFKQLIKQLLTSTITFEPGVRSKLPDLQFQSKFKDFYCLPAEFSYPNVDTRLKGKQLQEIIKKAKGLQKQYKAKQQQKKSHKMNIWQDDEMTNQKLIDLMLATL